MKKKQRVRRQKPPPVKKHGRPPATPDDETASAPAAASHAAPVHAIKLSGFGPAKFHRSVPKTSAKQGLSASETLALSDFIRLRRQRQPATKDSLKQSMLKSWISLHRKPTAAGPEPEPSNPLRDLLKACSTDSLEQSIADWFPLRLLPELSTSAADPEIQSRLIFRCFLVPSLCEAWVQAASKAPNKMSLFLFDYSTRVRAFDRLDSEISARANTLKAGNALGVASLPPRWLKCSPEEAVQRLDRFDTWRKAALKSFWHFYHQFCADMGLDDREELLNGFLAFAQMETPLPEKLQALLGPLGRLAPPTERKVFMKHQEEPKALRLGKRYATWLKDPKTAKFPSLIIECWLIEIWPLVLAEEWSFADVLIIAERKFGALDVLNDWKKLKKRCGALNLQVAEKRRHGGPPPKSRRIKHSWTPMAQLAADIQGIAEAPEVWMHNETG